MTKILTRRIFIIAPLVVLFAGIAYFRPNPGNPVSLLYKSEKMQLSIKSTYLSVDVADTDQEKITGLSNRLSLGSGEGMLFIYDSPVRPSFWMKDMRFPIDIIWISSDKVVVGIEHAVSPVTYPKGFQPAVPVQYVLEVRSGLSQEKGIATGDVVNF